ncbi:hypothetical protein RRV45_02135 [Bacillus sp. DTU_2020_1000418_1_SI_GHA_SEK_038]|nr:hypothetical protein [Bacillus sp. DTU_2020_1000418_1_SI_GHA_SEK_038]WNS75854.1 hypothetical protein RRV45_02135 [Bacillus sp. DTU_2020_1000418_1_SI_GHA_SEK_038]
MSDKKFILSEKLVGSNIFPKIAMIVIRKITVSAAPLPKREKEEVHGK